MLNYSFSSTSKYKIVNSDDQPYTSFYSRSQSTMKPLYLPYKEDTKELYLQNYEKILNSKSEFKPKSYNKTPLFDTPTAFQSNNNPVFKQKIQERNCFHFTKRLKNPQSTSENLKHLISNENFVKKSAYKPNETTENHLPKLQNVGKGIETGVKSCELKPSFKESQENPHRNNNSHKAKDEKSWTNQISESTNPNEIHTNFSLLRLKTKIPPHTTSLPDLVPNKPQNPQNFNSYSGLNTKNKNLLTHYKTSIPDHPQSKSLQKIHKVHIS